MAAFSDAEALSLREAWESAFDTMATVYDDQGGTGAFDHQVRTGLRCRLYRDQRRVVISPERAVMAGTELCTWDATYTMPANVQLEIRGKRWNLALETLEQRYGGPSDILIQQFAEAVRADA